MTAKVRSKKSPRRSQNDSQTLAREVRAHLRRLVRHPNVTSAGIGYKITNRKTTKDLSILVTVAEKLRPKELAKRRIPSLPKHVELPGGRRVPLDVVQRSFKLSYQLVSAPSAPALKSNAGVAPALLRRRRLDRVVPGISVSHIDGKAGTIGAIVYDRKTGRPCVLSNAHILTDITTRVGDAVVQPGLFDDSDVLANGLGTLLRSHFGLAGDCAIASLDTRAFDQTVLELGVVPKRIAEVAVGDQVVKSGRTTGVTRGIVVRLGVVTPYDYGGSIGVRSINGFEIGPDPAAPPPDDLIADEGDSGALWLIYENGTATNIAAGLHFANENDTEDGPALVLATPIRTVLEKLDVSLLPPA